jgi:hypothetical protein
LSRRLLPFNTRLGVSVMKSPKKSSNKPKDDHRDSVDKLNRKRDQALERVIAICLKKGALDEDELDKALDVLTVAHATATFEFVSGSFSS